LLLLLTNTDELAVEYNVRLWVISRNIGFKEMQEVWLFSIGINE